MKPSIHLFLTIVLIIFTQNIYTQDTYKQDLWTLGSADNLDKFYCEAGVFQPVRFGLTNKIEVSSLAISNIFSPNLSFKLQWWEREILVATKHGIYYPKFGLKKSDARAFNGNVRQILNARDYLEK